MLKTIKRWLSHHKNHQIGTYMDRWYIIPPQWNLPISVRLQHIKRADGERLPHNHPYAFKSIVLSGWYDEEQTKGWTRLSPLSDEVVFKRDLVRHGRFKLFRIAQKQYHRIVCMPATGVWTLIWHPRKPQQYEWGYLSVDGTHIPHAEYVRPPGYDLPYKASAYRREGPAHVLDTADTQALLDEIVAAAEARRPKLQGESVDLIIANPKAVQKGERI